MNIRSLQPYFNTMQTIKANSAESECIYRLLHDNKTENGSCHTPVTPPVFAGESKPCSVELCHVTFGYDKNKPPVLTDVSLSVPAGGFVSVIGAEESGKSTLLKIVGGILQPWDGEVLFDGKPLSENTSVRVNSVGFGNSLSVRDNLSAGERQIHQIAQALDTGCSVLVADGGVCIADTQTEKRILADIRHNGCTCVITSSRVSAVRDSDCIYILDKGSIVQQGTHLQLSSMQGIYRKIIRGL